MTFKQWLGKHERTKFQILIYSKSLDNYTVTYNSYTLYKHYYVVKEEEQIINFTPTHILYLKKDLS